MKAFAASNIGKMRQINEDSFFASNPDDKIQLYIVADGMGGYNGGEIASSLAVTAARNYILSNFEKKMDNKETLLELIKNSVDYANKVVFEKSRENEELKNMGTTLDICLIYMNKLFIGHIGDSRVYRIRKEFMRKLTKDHSYVQQLVDEGKITKEESINHPKKNMLIKALGCTEEIEPDVMVKGLVKDDILLMCTDGLTNMVKEEEIFTILKSDLKDPSGELIKKANENGGLDNITAVIIK